MGVKNCEVHPRYKAGCEDCRQRSRDYIAQKEKRPVIPKTPSHRVHGSEELWRKMTEIGQRVAREDQERRRK